MAGLVQRTGQSLGKGLSLFGGKGKRSDEDVTLPTGKVAPGGDVVGTSGDVIGRVVEGDPSSLVGSLVTQSGAILGKDGLVVGKAAPLDALLDTTSGALDGVTDTVGGVAKGVGETAGNVTKPVTSGVLGGDHEGGADEDEEPEDDFGVVEKKGKSRGMPGKFAPSESDFGAPAAGRHIDLKDNDEYLQTLSPNAMSQSDAGMLDGAAPEGIDEKLAGGAKETAEETGEQATGAVDKTAEETTKDAAPDADIPQIPEAAGVDTSAPVDADKAKDAAGSKLPSVGDEDVVGTAGKTLDDAAAPADADAAGKTLNDAAPAEAGPVTETVVNAPGEAAEAAEPAVGDATDAVEEAAAAAPVVDLAALEGLKINKGGNVVDADGKPLGKLVSGDPKKLAGKAVGKDGKILDSESGSVLGEVEPIVEEAKAELEEPFAKFAGATVDDQGKIIFDNASVGEIVDGDAAKLAGKTVDADGDVLDEHGNVVGHAELKPAIADELAEEAAAAAAIDYSVLKGAKVNKLGNLVDDKGRVIGRVTEGILRHLAGRKADANGDIWNDNGEKIGRAEPIPETERDDESRAKLSPFGAFDGATVDAKGNVVFNGEVVGKVAPGSGDLKQLRGMKVDADGDILDAAGNVVAKAERWEEPEPEPEKEPEKIDMSVLAGKRVNKAGNVVDGQGNIFGRLVEGDAKRLAGRMCDKDGNVRSESGDVLGRAELVSEGEREGMKEGPFAELVGCSVTREGKVVTPGGDVVGRLVSGDPKTLFGRSVDEDGDVCDRNGNVLGKAERWEEPTVEKKKGPMAGRRVNRQGEVVDEDGNIVGKLTSGELSICAGKEIDDDGDVVDSKGTTVGHVSLLGDIPAPPPVEEPGETAEEKEKRETMETDKKLAVRMAACVEQCLDKIRPICKMITQKIDKAERTPKDELDEEDLVKQVKPLIEEGGKILQEANGVIRGLDPDGRIQANAKHKTATREATAEEYHLADVLKELTGTVTQCIDDAKRKIEDMPHAKKELNPLWGLLTEPLFQILAAVGLLLAGVLNLVGRLLAGLGLGGLVDGLLGSLGLNRLLESLGLGSVVGALTGKKGKK